MGSNPIGLTKDFNSLADLSRTKIHVGDAVGGTAQLSRATYIFAQRHMLLGRNSASNGAWHRQDKSRRSHKAAGEIARPDR
jgi:hypothetical protein